MIDITIKTLDSRNHVFSVEDELTVKQLKEQIAEPVNVPVESQRLIYCGRVLVDEKKLSEYDVNGKVIHLVQRAPPSTTQESTNSSNEPRTTTSSERRGHPFRNIRARAGRLDGAGGNAMYLGAMAFPADLMDAQGISMPQPRHRLSQSRLSVARTMLRRARYTLLHLENPSHQESPQEINSNSDDVNAILGETVADFVARTSHVGVQHPPPHINIEEASGADGDMQAEETEATPDGNSPDESPSGEESGANAGNESSENLRNGRYRFPGPVHMAEIINYIRDIERRLSPFLERFHELVRTDPVLESSTEAQRLFDQVSKMMHFMAHAYHAISDIMCDFSQPPPRRLRCRPVLIQHSAVLQTGIPFQAQVNMGASGSSNASFSSSNQANPATSSNSETGPPEASSAAGAATAATPTASATEPPSEEPPQRQERTMDPEVWNNFLQHFDTQVWRRGGRRLLRPLRDQIQLSFNGDGEEADARIRQQQQERLEGRQPEPTPPPPPIAANLDENESRSNSGRTSRIVPGNLEFYMDVGQGSITIDSVEATLVTNPGQGSESGGTTTTIASGPFPWGSPMPPEFLQNLMQALAGHMMGGSSSSNSGSSGSGGGNATTGSGGSTGASATASSASNSGQAAQPSSESNVTNSQARGNTSTQPTTSTQTRSTTRPHVHIAPGFQGMGVPGFFDPFLPCNSHHIHGTRRRGDGQEASNTANTNNQSTSTSTRESTSTSTETPRTQSDAPSVFNLFSNPFQGVRGGNGSQGQGPSFIRILPRDVTVFLQGSPPMQNMTTLPVHTTVAEVLQNLPDDPYTEGESIFADFAMTLARNLRVIDVLNMGSPSSSVLTSLRPVLRDFIRNQLLGGQEGNQAVSDAVNRINTELRPLIESICAEEDVHLREDVDIVATVNQLNHTTIPILIRDVLEEDDARFLRNIPNHCNDYARHLASILLYCCENGQQGLDSMYTSLARRMIVGVPAALQNWSVVHIVNHLRAMTNGMETSSEAIQPFLVFRMADAPVDAVNPDQPQAMETEVANEVIPSPTPAPPAPTVQPSLPVPPALSPISVSPPPPILGTEQWHNAVPPDWVPIISRDRERQRRQAVQGPLSDAYLSGMPSKRRKVVTSAKPHTNLARVITESMSTALGAAGVACVDPGLAETAGGDTSLRAAYKEQVRNTLTPTLRHHPDFTPEKYPAAAKLFTPK